MIQGIENKFNISEVSISYSLTVHPSDRHVIKSSSQCYDMLIPFFGAEMETREMMFVVLMNTSAQVIGVYKVSSGGICATVADIRLILHAAVMSLATRIIIAHNHPTGNLTPSDADINVTKKLKECAELLDIDVLDHLIISNYGYMSLSDEGYLY